MGHSKQTSLEIAKAVMSAEASAILKASERLGSTFDSAIQILSQSKGKVVFAGLENLDT